MTKMRWAGSLVLLSTSLALGGCSTMQKTWNGWFGDEEPAASASSASDAGEQVYYSSVEGLTVYGQASSSSKVLGRLALHEKVTRSRTEHGYAFIRTEEGGLEGWVDNAKLDWRKPTAAASAVEAPAQEAPAAKEPEPGGAKGAEAVAPTATPTPAEAPPETPASAPADASPAAAEAAATPAPTPMPKAEPKMFDPY